MDIKTQFATPAIVELGGTTAQPLISLPIEAAGTGKYDERWLQELLYRLPSLIPIEEVEPSFSGAMPVCMELPTAVGPLDLLFVNEQGLLTMVECKLWRNPEARRKVVGQILDYAQQISRWSYEDLDAAIRRSEVRGGASLWQIAQAAFGLTDEALFIDRVSRHLRNGAFLLLIVGDGIRENTESIAAFLQKHAGLSFALGLVEERLFLLPDGESVLVQPRILAKTVEIGRLIVRAEAGIVTAEAAEEVAAPKHSRTLTESIFIEDVAGNSALAGQLSQLFARLKEEEFSLQASSRGRSLKVVPNGTKMNLLTLSLDGKVMNHGCGNSELGRAYLDSLRELLPKAQVRVGSDAGWSSTVLRSDGSPFRIEEIVAIQDRLIDLWRDVRDKLRARDDSEAI